MAWTDCGAQVPWTDLRTTGAVRANLAVEQDPHRASPTPRQVGVPRPVLPPSCHGPYRVLRLVRIKPWWEKTHKSHHPLSRPRGFAGPLAFAQWTVGMTTDTNRTSAAFHLPWCAIVCPFTGPHHLRQLVASAIS